VISLVRRGRPRSGCLSRRSTAARGFLGASRLARRRRSLGGAPLARHGACLLRKRCGRRRRLALALERSAGCHPSTHGGRAARRLSVTTLGGALSPSPRLVGASTALWWWKIDSGASCFRKADCDCLLRRPRAVLAFADVVNFFADELSCLGRRRLALSLCPLNLVAYLFLRHFTPPLVDGKAPCNGCSGESGNRTCVRYSQRIVRMVEVQ
jgi:hypothetical protein